MNGYTRQSSATILATKPVAAGPVNAEFDQLVDAFGETSGHAHDGTAAGGANVPYIADTGDTKVDITGDTIEFSIGGSVFARFVSGDLRPVTGTTVDVGELTNRFGGIFSDTITVNTLTVSTGGTITVNSGATIDMQGNLITDLGTATATGHAVDFSLLNTTIANNLTISSTSTSSNTVGSGDLTFVIADSMDLSSGPFVTVSDTADAENYVFGQITSWTSGTKTAIVRVHSHSGSGTLTSWNFNISGVEGPEADTTNLLNVSGDTLNNTTLTGVFTAATGSSMDVNGALDVENTGTFQGDVTVGNDLTVNNSVTVNGTLNAVTGSSSILYNVHLTGGEKFTLVSQAGATGALITLSETGDQVHDVALSGDITINILPAKTGEFYTKYMNIVQDSAGGRQLTYLFNSGSGNTGGVYFDDGANGAATDFTADGASVARTATLEVFTTFAVVSVGGNYKAIS